MKKILFAGASAMFFLISCNDSSTSSTDTTADTTTAMSTTSTETSQNEKNLESNRKVYKAIETGDSATIASLIADDAVDHQGPNGQDIKGRDSITRMLSGIHNHVKDLKLDIIADAANGDYIFALANISGTTNDPWMGMPAGAKVDEKGVDVIKVRDGKMVEHWGFVDPNEMMKQMKGMKGRK